jgi:hypothetical protein
MELVVLLQTATEQELQDGLELLLFGSLHNG